jgi:hypothetical protein
LGSLYLPCFLFHQTLCSPSWARPNQTVFSLSMHRFPIHVLFMSKSSRRAILCSPSAIPFSLESCAFKRSTVDFEIPNAFFIWSWKGVIRHFCSVTLFPCLFPILSSIVTINVSRSYPDYKPQLAWAEAHTGSERSRHLEWMGIVDWLACCLRSFEETENWRKELPRVGQSSHGLQIGMEFAKEWKVAAEVSAWRWFWILSQNPWIASDVRPGSSIAHEICVGIGGEIRGELGFELEDCGGCQGLPRRPGSLRGRILISEINRLLQFGHSEWAIWDSAF